MFAASTRRAAPRPVYAVALAAFVACVWLNQSPGPRAWAEYVARVRSAPAAHVLDAARYPFAYLYKRAADEKLYYEVANLVLGRPADVAFLEQQRGKVTPEFDRPSPPADGRWHLPYAEVPLEYPVLALPFILAPRLVTSSFDAYGYLFGALMGACLAAAIAVALDAARRAGVDDEGLRARGWLASGLLLAQGAIAVQRLDAVTALAIALAVRSAVARRPLAFGLWSGLATATKFVPALVWPAVLVAAGRSFRSRPAMARAAVGFAGALAGGLGPMWILSPHALGRVLSYHAARGLQCESTMGLLLAVVRLATGARVAATLSYGSYNFDGPAADVLAALSGPLSVAASLGVAAIAWRGAGRAAYEADDGPRRVACAAFTALVAVWLTGKVLSTQYMTWGIPVVLAIPAILGRRLAWLLLAAMAATQFYVCGHSELVIQGRALGVLNLGVRQAILVAAGWLAARALASGRVVTREAFGPIGPPTGR